MVLLVRLLLILQKILDITSRAQTPHIPFITCDSIKPPDRILF